MELIAELIPLIDKVTGSTDEDQVINDVVIFIQYIIDAYDARQLLMNYSFYKLFTTLIDELTFKQYFKVLDVFYTSKLHLHQEAGLRFEPITVFKLGVDNNLLNVVQWAFPKCDVFQELSYGDGIMFQPWITACHLGYLEIAQFILDKLRKQRRFKVIVIEKNAMGGFEVACKNGNTNIVEWLLSLEFKYEYKPDIIKAVCDKHFINVLDALIRFRPYKLCVVFNADRTRVVSYVIHSLQEEKWLQRKLPLLAHYCQDDYNKFQHVPIEIVRHICEFV